MDFYIENNRYGRRRRPMCRNMMPQGNCNGNNNANTNPNNQANADLLKTIEDLKKQIETIKNSQNTGGANTTDKYIAEIIQFTDDGRYGVQYNYTDGTNKQVITGYNKEVTLTANTPLTIQHNLGSIHLDVSVFDKETNRRIGVTEKHIDDNSIEFTSTTDKTVIISIKK